MYKYKITYPGYYWRENDNIQTAPGVPYHTSEWHYVSEPGELEFDFMNRVIGFTRFDALKKDDTYCWHDWQHYIGFHLEEYDFCTKCDEKRDKK